MPLCLQGNEAVESLLAKVPAASLAALVALMPMAGVAHAADFAAPPANTAPVERNQTLEFGSVSAAPALTGEYQLPEGAQW